MKVKLTTGNDLNSDVLCAFWVSENWRLLTAVQLELVVNLLVLWQNFPALTNDDSFLAPNRETEPENRKTAAILFLHRQPQH